MAMGIIQALELQEGPIDALTKLDQKQIIALAQQKRIPQDMVSVILNEKALNEQEAANIAAAQKPMSRSVIEQAMAINAQAEAMRNQPRMMAMDTGVASLPVPEEMYSGEGYAGGGIVAFDNGGGIDLASMYNTATKEMDEESARRVPNPYAYSSRVDPNRVEELVGARGALRERIAPQSAKVDAIQRYLDDQARKNTDVRTDAWARALEAGLGIMGGESPYALTNIGKGSQAAVKGFAEDVKERRKQNLANMQLQLQLDEAGRKEKLGDIASAEATALKELEYGRDLEKSRIASQKEKVMDTYAMNFLEAYRGRPDFKGLTDTQILQLGREDYLKRSTAFDPRMLSAQAAMGASNVGANRESTQDYEAAAKIVNEGILARGASKDPRRQKYNDLVKEDQKPENKSNPDYVLKAPAYKDQLISDELNKMRGGRSSTAPTAPATPTSKTVTPPSAAVNLLKRDPSDANKQYFDQTFGSGAAAKALAK
jgi:hypothetical protein